MAKINNRTIYPVDSTLSDNDSWLSIDAEDSNKAKTLTIGAVKEFIVAEIGSGTGDMVKSVYDPLNKVADAFDMTNMVESTNKKILTPAERTAIASGTTHIANTSNPHSVTATQVGLSNVDNTSDANKPVSTAQQTALDLKQDTLVSGTNIKTINGVTVLGTGDIILGGGAVDSVNAQTGAVVLDADDIDDTATVNKFVTAAEKTLISTALQAETQTLQAVTDLGSTTTKTITSTNGTNYSSVNNYGGFTQINGGGATRDMVEMSLYNDNPTVKFYKDSTVNGVFLGIETAATAPRQINLPDASGTVALTSNIPDTISQAEAEAGIATTERIFTAERVKQAIVALGGSGSVDNTAYAVSWNGVLTVAPSKNAIYDLIENQVFKVDTNSNIIPVFWGGTQAEYDIDFPTGHPPNYFVIITDGAITPLNAADIVNTPSGNLIATDVQAALNELQTEIDGLGGGGLTAADIDTLAELNAIITDATLIDTTDARLSDARTPLAHTHTASEVTDFDTEVANNTAVALNTAKLGVTTEEANTIDSVTAGEPTGATNISNIVWITQANYDAAVTAVTTVATTLYVING